MTQPNTLNPTLIEALKIADGTSTAQPTRGQMLALKNHFADWIAATMLTSTPKRPDKVLLCEACEGTGSVTDATGFEDFCGLCDREGTITYEVALHHYEQTVQLEARLRRIQRESDELLRQTRREADERILRAQLLQTAAEMKLDTLMRESYPECPTCGDRAAFREHVSADGDEWLTCSRCGAQTDHEELTKLNRPPVEQPRKPAGVVIPINVPAEVA